MSGRTNAGFPRNLLKWIADRFTSAEENIAGLQEDVEDINDKLADIETNPLIKTVEYDVTVPAVQGYSGETTRIISSITGYTFIGFTDPYCQPNSGCSIKSVNGTTITIEGFNGGGGNPQVHFSALYIKS